LDVSSGERGGGFAIVALGAIVIGAVWLLWLAGQLSAVFSGHGWPDSSPADAFDIVPKLVSAPGDPAAAWPRSEAALLGPTWLIYSIFVGFLVVAVGVVLVFAMVWTEWRRRRGFRWGRLGFASAWEIWRQLGRRALLRRVREVRPAIAGAANVSPLEVGYYLGRDVRTWQSIYSSVEDPMLVIGAPRQGKDAHFVAPFTMDAPGACVVISTQLETFTSTYPVRARMGKVFVFDPDNMTSWPVKTRLGFVQGCEDPNMADDVATTIAKYSGFFQGGYLGSSRDTLTSSVSSAVFTVLRCYLHAAALHGRTTKDVVRWSRRQADPEPLELLRQAEAAGVAIPGWAAELEQFMSIDDASDRTSIWASVSQCLRFLIPPDVLEQFSPDADDIFDIKEFVSGRNTLYILGKERGDNPIMPGVHVLLEALLARMGGVSRSMPGGRMEPPVTMEFNEAPIIAPVGWMPRGMGLLAKRSVAMHVYARSISELRGRYGDDVLKAIWDFCAFRIILGGAANTDDLADISRMVGEVREPSLIAGSAHNDVLSPILTVDELRTLKFGQAVVVPRNARPVEVALTPWWKRKDGREIAAAKVELERYVQHLSTSQVPDTRVQDYIRAATQRQYPDTQDLTPVDTAELPPVVFSDDAPGIGPINPPYARRGFSGRSI
jgi:type IV secretory pathway TraG/TraD family ATPase VirD4